MNENMCSTHTKGPQAWRLRILALALTLAVQGVPTTWAATFTVNSTADDLTSDGSCTLREAIIAANIDDSMSADCPATGGAVGVDVINLPAGTYLLAIAGINENAAVTGDLDITDDLTISGAGAATTIIDANEIDRVFHVIDANVTFSDVTISNGMANGSGSGIFNNGGTVTLTDSIVSGNTSAEDGAYDGGGIANLGGTLALRNSTVSDNTATDAGGGIFNNSGATVTLINSTVSDNTAPHDGGGIRNQMGTVDLIDSTVRGNTTMDDGAGMRNNGGTVTLINSTVSGNTAADPDGVTNFGGGIFNNNGGILTLTNSTVSGNTAADQGGGMRNDTGSTVTLSNSTVIANTAGGRGGGIRNLGTVNFQNTIIAGNEADSGRDCSLSTSTGGTLTSLGNNLVGAFTGCPSSAMGDQTVDPVDVFTMVLGPLQDNGGPTDTHALLAGSPAIDAGNPVPPGCTDDTGATLTTDQRGVRRPLGLACDIGAYEFATLIPVDIKPESCPNPLNVKGGGSLPVAILGTEAFDVTQVDVATVQLEGVSPLRTALEDVTIPFDPFIGKENETDCTDEGPDGFLDRTLKFDKQEIVDALGDVEDGDVLVLILTGELFDGTPITGEDVVVILKKGR